MCSRSASTASCRATAISCGGASRTRSSPGGTLAAGNASRPAAPPSATLARRLPHEPGVALRLRRRAYVVRAGDRRDGAQRRSRRPLFPADARRRVVARHASVDRRCATQAQPFFDGGGAPARRHPCRRTRRFRAASTRVWSDLARRARAPCGARAECRAEAGAGVAADGRRGNWQMPIESTGDLRAAFDAVAVAAIVGALRPAGRCGGPRARRSSSRAA